MLGFAALGQTGLGQTIGSATAGQTTPVFAKFGMPAKTALAVAVIGSFAGFVAPPQAQAAQPFVQFSQPQTLKPRQAAWINTPAQIAQVFPSFTQFSQPLIQRGTLSDEQPSALFEVKPPAPVVPLFTAFSQPLIGKTPLPDEQPSSLFLEIPVTPPFTGFAKFTDFILSKSRAYLSSYVSFTYPPALPDTHDGVWVKRRKKQKDPIELRLEEQRARRAAIELAVYGPPIEVQLPAQPAPVPVPVVLDVRELAALIAAQENALRIQRMAQSEADEEDDIEAIMREIMS